MPACEANHIFPVSHPMFVNPVYPLFLPYLSQSSVDLAVPILIVIEGIIVLTMALLVIRSWWLRRQEPEEPGK